MILILLHILVTCLVGATLFLAVHKYERDDRLANLLKILVVLACVAAILRRLVPLIGFGFG